MNKNYFRIVAILSIVTLLVIAANIDTIKYNHLNGQKIFCNNSREIVEMDGYERKCAFTCNYEYNCTLKSNYTDDTCYCGDFYKYDNKNHFEKYYYEVKN